MSHPCLVTLDRDSAPRVLFSGDRLVEVDLPAGTRVLYPKPALPALQDVDAAIRAALDNPSEREPLASKLRPGMKVTVAIDDVSVPFPEMRSPDVRQRILDIVLKMAVDRGVSDVEVVIATGLNRRLRPKEVRHLVGDRVFSSYWPTRLYNHDPEDATSMVVVGETEYGEVLDLNRRAAESDLIVTVSVCSLPLHGGYHTACVGLGGPQSFRAHHGPTVLRRCHSYMDPDSSGYHTCLTRMGRLLEESLDIFAIEVALDNRVFGSPLSFLGKNEDDLNERDRLLLKGLVGGSARLPAVARQALLDRAPVSYGVTLVSAGATEAAHDVIAKRCAEQYAVPIEGQADVLVTGVAPFSPYNQGAFLNPLLATFMAEGLLFNMYRGAPLVKKNGTLIITHPCTDRFDHEQHAPYLEFLNRLLPETRDGVELHRRFESTFAQNPAFLEMFRKGHSYHPVHPFHTWYFGEAGRQHLGRVIVVGADNEYVPKLLGYETAPNMAEALYRAKAGEAKSLDILCLHSPPFAMGDVTVASAAP